jgi:1-acyl-sn-glycerol-3-phosphate acyltransferase
MGRSASLELAESPEPLPSVANALLAVAKGYRLYHRHHVRGFEHLERALARGKPVLLVSNHCLEVTDPMMFASAVYERIGRFPRFIGHETIFFQLKAIRRFAETFGALPSRHPDLAERALREERLLMLYPGAGTEASLRLYRRERYRLKWQARTGFVRLALRTRATLLFVAGVGIDDMYYQTDWRVPDRLFDLPFLGYLSEYRGLRAQLGAAGLHLVPGVFPLPVRVTHVISPPIAIDRSVDPDDDDAVTRAQLDVWSRCQAFLDRQVARRETDLVDRWVRGAEQMMERLGV